MRIRIAAIGMLFLLSVTILSAVQNANDLYQQGLARETAGDIQGAIRIFERIVRDSSNRTLTARALLQLGQWSDSLGQDQSRRYYERVISDYGDQAAVVGEARKRLNGKANTPKEIATPFTNDPWSFALSPNGRLLVFVATVDGKTSLWLQNLESGKQGRPIPGTEGTGYGPGTTGANPFWSPDGRFIAYFEDQKLKRIPFGGGTPQPLANAPRNAGGTWNAAGDIVFSPSFMGPLYRVSADGGEEVALTRLTQGVVGHRYPQFLPDGRRFLIYPAQANAFVGGRLMIGTLDSPEVEELPLVTASAAFAPPNHVVYVSGGALHVQALDLKKLDLTGSSRRIAERVAGYIDNSGVGAFSVSLAGTIAYRADAIPRRRLTWRDRMGSGATFANQAPLSSITGVPRLSPDGRFAALAQNNDQKGTALLLVDVTDGRSQSVDLGLGVISSPIWSPSGDSFAFSALQPGVPTPLFLRRAGGNGDGSRTKSQDVSREPLLQSAEGVNPTDWQGANPQDWYGNFLLFTRTSPSTRRDLMVTTVPATDEPIPVAVTSAQETNGRFSPNGKWIAYQSDGAGGRNEIFVQQFPGTTSAPRRVSINGGTMPEWNRDGRELYFLSPDNRLMAAAVTVSADGTDIEIGKPAPLFLSPLLDGSTYAPSPDGRFLISEPIEAATPIYILPNALGEKK